MAKSKFEDIFLKHLLKNKEPLHRFEDDIGSALNGQFSWQKFDTSGRLLEQHSAKNAITHLSKSTIIRLISQGISEQSGQVVPSDYKISKMRFGNATEADGTKLATETDYVYIDYVEQVNRSNLASGAGGKLIGETIGSESGSTKTNAVTLPKTTLTAASSGDGFYLYEMQLSSNTTRPPSHKTLNVSFNFSDAPGTTFIYNFLSEYSKHYDGTIASAPETPSNKIQSVTLKFDNNKWKIIIKLNKAEVDAMASGVTTAISANYVTGKFNVANSIVPVVGYNHGTSGSSRYSSSQKDHYSVQQLTYSNLAGIAIDDYMVNFSVSMQGTEGNGHENRNADVVYSEAFLFTENDNLFSIIQLEGASRFNKNKDSAYLLTWSISAAV